MLAKGNRKISSNVGVFSLPSRITCPDRTILCERYCYAKKREYFSIVRAYRMKNLSRSKDSNFVQEMVQEIQEERFRYIRIHASGDFYSPEYFDKWLLIAKSIPNVIFLAYTKSRFVFNQRNDIPSNMILYYSVWQDTKIIPANAKLMAYTLEKKETPIGYVCPGKGCGSDCVYCYNGSGNVTFYKH